MTAKTRKNVPWKGWKKIQPGFHQKTMMLKNCGKKCFLGPNKSFPICKKNTCKKSKKGIYAAFVRAQQYLNKTGKQKYRTISMKAKKLLHKL